MKKYDFLIVGGGVFGITTAVALAKRDHKVGLINPDTIPHHMAASSDISKAVRMEYGSDLEYFKMAELCIKKWKEWNDILDEQIYHEVGFLMLSKGNLDKTTNSYEQYSYRHLVDHGFNPQRYRGKEITNRFPAVNSSAYEEACFNKSGGYVESGRAVECLVKYAKSLGVDIHEGQTAQQLHISNNQLTGITTKENKTFHCGHAILAAGPYTPYLLPELKPYMKATGHPVFWLTPKDPSIFVASRLPVFMADISKTGWYGFPFSEKHGVVKVAKHAHGLLMNPNTDDRQVTAEEVNGMRHFLKSTFPDLADAPLVYTRRCLYGDTLDGHFWIDRHPEIAGLTVSTGGSGHGMKMGPVLGEMTADKAEGKMHQWSHRYDWRHLDVHTIQTEEARFLDEDSVSP